MTVAMTSVSPIADSSPSAFQAFCSPVGAM
jgi:hypothetical protein